MIRRAVSVLLLIVAGWVLATVGAISWIVVGNPDVAERLGMIGIMTGFATPFLLLGMWTSPGNRFADIGMTMMIAAGVSAFIGLAVVLVMNDPGMKQFMPPDRPMPAFDFGPGLGLANLLITGGGGWLLWRFGNRGRKSATEELERVFGDG